jgi:Phage terminase, small subunit
MAYKKSIKEKENAGTLNVTREKGRANIKAVNSIKEISPPDFLDENAVMIWKFAVSQMTEEHVKSLDMSVFCRWCSLFSDFCQVSQLINEAGLVVEDDETGIIKENMLLKTKIKLSETLLGLEKQLGFTPLTRNSVIIPNEEDADAAQFLELLK